MSARTHPDGDGLPARIPVTMVAGAAADTDPGIVTVRLPPARHAHAEGVPCPACAARGDVRLLLHDLLVRAQRGEIGPFSAVVVETGDNPPGPVADALVPGRLPATALRDHTVARRFYLADGS